VRQSWEYVARCMDKNETLAVFSALADYIDSTLIATGLLVTSGDYTMLRGRSIMLGAVPVLLDGALERVRPGGGALRQSVISNAVCIAVRAALKEAYQALDAYARDTKQLRGGLDKEAWFQFLRLMRNSLEHSGPTCPKFCFRHPRWGMDKYLPVTWSGKTLTGAMDGSPIDVGFFSLTDALALVAAAENYVITKMK